MIMTGMHESVVQLNPGIASFTGRAGRTGSRSTLLTVDQRHLPTAFSQGFISKAVQGFEVTFIQQGGTLSYTRHLRAEVMVDAAAAVKFQLLRQNSASD